MTLEDVVKGFLATEATAAVAERNSMTDAQGVYGALDYLGENGQEWVGMENNAEQLDGVAKYLVPLVKKKAIADTRVNVNEVLGTFDLQTLAGLAIGLSSDAEELKNYTEVLNEKNYGAMKGLLVKKDDEGNPDRESLFNRLYLTTARPEQLVQVVEARQASLEKEFIRTYLSMKEEGDGEDVSYRPDKDVAAKYVAETASKVGDDAYVAIGARYTQNRRVAAQNRDSESA